MKELKIDLAYLASTYGFKDPDGYIERPYKHSLEGARLVLTEQELSPEAAEIRADYERVKAIGLSPAADADYRRFEWHEEVYG